MWTRCFFWFQRVECVAIPEMLATTKVPKENEWTEKIASKAEKMNVSNANKYEIAFSARAGMNRTEKKNKTKKNRKNRRRSNRTHSAANKNICCYELDVSIGESVRACATTNLTWRTLVQSSQQMAKTKLQNDKLLHFVWARIASSTSDTRWHERNETTRCNRLCSVDCRPSSQHQFAPHNEVNFRRHSIASIFDFESRFRHLKIDTNRHVCHDHLTAQDFYLAFRLKLFSRAEKYGSLAF